MPRVKTPSGRLVDNEIAFGFGIPKTKYPNSHLQGGLADCPHRSRTRIKNALMTSIKIIWICAGPDSKGPIENVAGQMGRVWAQKQNERFAPV